MRGELSGAASCAAISGYVPAGELHDSNPYMYNFFYTSKGATTCMECREGELKTTLSNDLTICLSCKAPGVPCPAR